MRRIVELTAASLPWAIRDRYREEWLHDLEHAEEVGVRRGDIAWGAVRTAIAADRMQAPSPAHAILQARTRIDTSGMHLSTAMMHGLLAMQSTLFGLPVVAILLACVGAGHVAMGLTNLHLASRMVGGLARFATPLLLLGLGLMAVVITPGFDLEWPWWSPWLGLAGIGCLVTAMIFIESTKPPKPELRWRLRPEARRRLLAIGASIGVLTILLAALDAVVLAPARWSALPIADAWTAIGAAGGPPSALAAMGQLGVMMLVPIIIGIVVGARWARSERGVMAWTTAGALVALAVAFTHATTLAVMLPHLGPGVLPAAVILPLLAGGLAELAGRLHRDLAPLPPASVPIPPGP